MLRLVSCVVLVGCASSPARDVEREVKAAARAFDAAQLAHDRATLDRFLAHDFVFVRGSGKLAGRDDFLASFADPSLELEPFEITNPVFVRLGDTSGLVGGETVMKGKEKGTPFVGRSSTCR